MTGTERDEAEHPTPVRGVPMPPAQHSVWGEAPAPAPTRQERRARRGLVWQVAALVIGLAGTLWFSTDFYRENWHRAAPRDPVVEVDGVATLAGISVSLVEATDLGPTPDLTSGWVPPHGFHAWRVVLETTSTNSDLFSCDVDLVDDRGRQFRATYFIGNAGDGYEYSYMCGEPDETLDVGPQQALLVLVPEDAEIESVRISDLSLNPDYIELSVP